MTSYAGVHQVGANRLVRYALKCQKMATAAEPVQLSWSTQIITSIFMKIRWQRQIQMVNGFVRIFKLNFRFYFHILFSIVIMVKHYGFSIF